MSFPVEPGKLLREVEAAMESTADHLSGDDDIAAKRAGRAYRESQRSEHDYWRENFFHDWESMILPRLVYANPRVKATTEVLGVLSDDVEALHWGLNSWILATDLRKFLADGPFRDMQYHWGVTATTIEPRKGLVPVEDTQDSEAPGVPHMPHVYRLEPRDYFEDSLARTRDAIRFQGHRWVRDREDIEREAEEDGIDWNLDLLHNMEVPANYDERPVDRLERDEVVGYEVWVPEYELDDSPGPKKGFHGTVFTLPAGLRSSDDPDLVEWLLPPKPYFGPPSGPYTMYGVYTVAGDPKPLGPLVALYTQIEDVNVQADVMHRSASSYKRMVFVMNAANKLAEQVKSGEHDYVFDGTLDPDGQIVSVEVGGVTEQMVGVSNIVTERLERLSGYSDAQRGMVSGRGTATENAIADQKSDIKVGWIQQQAESALIENLTKVAWYMWHSSKVAFGIDPAILGEMGHTPEIAMGEDGEPLTDEQGRPKVLRPQAMYRGGTKSKDVSFEDLRLEIEPYSMQRTNERLQQEQAAQAAQFILATAPLIPQTPYVRWKELYDFLGDGWNISDMGRFVDEEMAMQFIGLPPEAAGPEPKMQTKPRLVGGSRPSMQGQRGGMPTSAGFKGGMASSNGSVKGKAVGGAKAVKGA